MVARGGEGGGGSDWVGRRLLVREGCGVEGCGCAGRGWAQNPFKSWDTVQDRLYTFCSNSSGALSDEAVAKIAKGKIMIHGLEVRLLPLRKLVSPPLTGH